ERFITLPRDVVRARRVKMRHRDQPRLGTIDLRRREKRLRRTIVITRNQQRLAILEIDQVERTHPAVAHVSIAQQLIKRRKRFLLSLHGARQILFFPLHSRERNQRIRSLKSQQVIPRVLRTQLARHIERVRKTLLTRVQQNQNSLRI